MKNINDLDAAIKQVCPIAGLSGDINDKANIRIDFDKSATDQQMQAAKDLLAAFDVTGKAPNIPRFFNDLGLAILAGSIPADVHDKAQLLAELKNLTDQQNALVALAADPSYTKAQKDALQAIIVANNLTLPPIPGA